MNRTSVRKIFLLAGLAGMIAVTAQAQFSAGKLAVLRAGDNGTSPASSILNAHQAPCFIDQYDPATPIAIAGTNMGTNGPLFSVAIPTNDPTDGDAAMWINGHAGTEGYLAQSDDLATLAFSGYGGDILATNGTPSQLAINRGICVIDVSGNSYIPYESEKWYGLGVGAQTNPRGAVSDDGTNNFFGSGSLDGNEWFQLGNVATPESIQNFNSTRAVKIINGFFYTSLQAGDGGTLYPPGIYNYAPPTSGGGLGSPVALPEGNIFFLNLVIPASPLYPNVESFDVNPQKTVAYMADNTYGVTKYVEVGGNWQLACAFGITNNTSSNVVSFPSSYTGCFGLAVDWSGPYPVVFATTTEGNGGYANSNRLIRIDDNFNYTDGQLHTNENVTTLATGWSANVVFKGLAWTPDRRPMITSNPAGESVVSGLPASFTVVATALFTNTYEWLVNGAVDPSQTTATYSLASALASATYQAVVSNQFGAVTSTVANLTVTASPTAPSLISPVPALNLTNAIGDTITLPVVAAGTSPLSYQWWFSASPGSTTAVTDGGDYTNSATSALAINVSSAADAGSYYVVVNNSTAPASSNLVATVTIVTPLPVFINEPASVTAVASNGNASINVAAYPIGVNCSYQWYFDTSPLFDNANYSGSQSPNLTINDAQSSDAGSYYVVVTDNGGSVTSTVATVIVETPAPYSALPYTSIGAVYQQNFDSLPDPGVTSVNNNTTTFPQTIGGTNYSVSNPFDFAAALLVSGEVNSTNGPAGGLDLSGMVGWYSSDLGAEQIQATSGDNTTGLIVSFGCTNLVNTVNPLYPTNNRALGIISSPATSAGGNAGNPTDGLFALRVRNLTGQTLTNFNLSYVSELWRDTQTTNIVTNWFYVDTFGTNTTPTNGWTGGLTNLLFNTNQPGLTKSNNKIYGTNGPVAMTNMAFVNVPLTTPLTPGGVLWIVWEETTATSGGQGIGIDNLVFSMGGPTLQIQPQGANVQLLWPEMFSAYTLQSNSIAVNNQAGWMNVPQTPTVSNGMNVVTLPANALQEYFQLYP